MGRLQLDFLVEHGLTPDSYVLDVACGALRAGIPLVGYLDRARYYGIDMLESLLEAGFWLELSSELGKNFRATTSARPTASTATSASSSTSHHTVALHPRDAERHPPLHASRRCGDAARGTFLRDVLRGSARAPAPRHSRARDRAKEAGRGTATEILSGITRPISNGQPASRPGSSATSGWNHPSNQRMIELTRTL